MPDIKWIDPTEFREAGFLQEANRQFFHPHGLALAVITVREGEGPVYALALDADQYARLMDLVAPDAGLTEVATEAARYEAGESYFQGCWDARDDPEGVLFGSWYGQHREKVERVAAERERHREAREAMFGEGSDIEHIGFTYEEPDPAASAEGGRRRPARAAAPRPASAAPVDRPGELER